MPVSDKELQSGSLFYFSNKKHPAKYLHFQKKHSNEYELILPFINNNPSKNWEGGPLQK